MSEGLRELLAAQLLKDNDDTKFNVRDFTDVLFDLEDPIDLTAAGLTATGAGVPVAAGIKALNTKRKAANLLRALFVPTKASKNPTKEVGRKIGNVVKFQVAGETAADVIPGVDGMAMGGIAQLQDGGKLERVLENFPRLGKFFKLKKGVEKAKDAKKVSKTDGEKPLLISPRSDLKKVRDAAEAILKSDLTRKTLRGAQRLGLYGGATGLAGYGAMKGADALFGDDKEETAPPPSIGAPIEKPKSFLEKLQDMDPALARALIAGGAKMLQPTEGPARSFLGLGEFGEGFSESLAASEAGKPVEQKAYEAYVDSIPEGETVPTYADYLNYFTMKQDDRTNLESRVLQILRDRFDKKVDLSDIVLVDVAIDPDTGVEKETQIGANEALLNAGVNYKEVLNRIATEGKLKS